MGQLLILQSAERALSDPAWARSVAVLDDFAGVRMHDQLESGALRAAKYPRLAGASSGIFRDPASGFWACGAGSWFYDGVAGEAGLRKLCAAIEATGFSDFALRPLDGSFAISVGRGGDGGFHVITDRIGTIHVYVTSTNGIRLVSTSSAALAAIADASWDECGCREFLATGTIFEHRTLFRGIEKLGPATVTHFPKAGQISRRTYWNLGEHMFDADSSGSVESLAQALEGSVRTILRCYPKAIFDLTGGYDSRAVLGAALRTQANLPTVVNGSDNDADVIAANRIAREFALDHRQQHRNVSQPREAARRALSLCDGEYDVLEYSGTLSAHLPLAEMFDATVNGSNGEICKGYWWELLIPHTGSKEHFDSRIVAQKRFLIDTRAADLLETRESFPLVDHFAAMMDRANAPLAGYPNTALMDNVYLTLRMQRWQGRIASATNRVWPCISPFMFRAVMEAALAAPPRVRIRHRMTRRLIERLNPRLAALPLAQGYPALPLRPNTAHRFWPLVSEVAGGIKRKALAHSPSAPRPNAAAGRKERLSAIAASDEFRDLMQPSRMKSGRLYDREKLSRFLPEAASPQLGRILTLEMLALRIHECAERAASAQELRTSMTAKTR